MCGIVGAIAERNVTPILINGLKRLEYRGYDSAGVALVNADGLARVRCEGKVAGVEAAAKGVVGNLGIAHTRWATHGVPCERNAHPHLSGAGLALVHNGIIENYQELREELKAAGYAFTSDTDSEVIVHLIHQQLQQGMNLHQSVKNTVARLKGAYALGVISAAEPDHLVAVRSGSPLVIGLGLGENFIASDQLALLPVTNRFIFLEEGELADIRIDSIQIENAQGESVLHEVHEFDGNQEDAEKGEFRHFMLKEIFEQPLALQKTLEGRIDSADALFAAFGDGSRERLAQVQHIQIVACGTSYHAGLVARYWIEALAGIPCRVEVASEFRYRKHVVPKGTLFVTISQSGETADTLAALRGATNTHYVGQLAVCNVASSSLVRESSLAFLTKAGPEIGVASTKAFTTQLVALLLLALALRDAHQAGDISATLASLRQLPNLAESCLKLDHDIASLSERFVEKEHTLFLGRGALYPVALEGALKLKEISYIHAEAYPAGELKHGPLALIDREMPVVVVAPNDELLEKLKSNLEEVRARGGELYVFADRHADMSSLAGGAELIMPQVPELLAPILYTIPLQLLSYHIAVLRGTDVDQPRNLAKSVTVE
jgi:glucosamine--fructose-6-phosphate aminotransferase (isomerizing)